MLKRSLYLSYYCNYIFSSIRLQLISPIADRLEKSFIQMQLSNSKLRKLCSQAIFVKTLSLIASVHSQFFGLQSVRIRFCDF